jgi:hypothetical protein
MTAEQQGVSPATAGGADAPGPWDVGHNAVDGRALYVRGSSPSDDVFVGVIFEPADAARIVETMNAAEQPRLADPRDTEIERLRGHSAARFRDLCAALETDPSIERWDSLLSGVGAAIAERDRLRQQLDQARGETNLLRRALATIHGITSDIDAKPAEPRRWHVGDPEPEIGTTVWRGPDKYTRSRNGWHRIDIHTGYGSWAWILSIGSEVVEVVGTDG